MSHALQLKDHPYLIAWRADCERLRADPALVCIPGESRNRAARRQATRLLIERSYIAYRATLSPEFIAERDRLRAEHLAEWLGRKHAGHGVAVTRAPE